MKFVNLQIDLCSFFQLLNECTKMQIQNIVGKDKLHAFVDFGSSPTVGLLLLML